MNTFDFSLTRDFQPVDWPIFAYHLCKGCLSSVSLSSKEVLAIHHAANITVPLLLHVDNDMEAYPKAINLLFNQVGLQLKAIDNTLSADQQPQMNQTALLLVFTKLAIMGNTLSNGYNSLNKEISILGIARHLDDFLNALYSEGFIFC